MVVPETELPPPSYDEVMAIRNGQQPKAPSALPMFEAPPQITEIPQIAETPQITETQLGGDNND